MGTLPTTTTTVVIGPRVGKKTVMEAEATVVDGEASESEDETLKNATETYTASSSKDQGVAFAVQIGKQVASFSGLEIKKTDSQIERPIDEKEQYQSILHKKLFQKNDEISDRIAFFFEDIFTKRIEEISNINTELNSTHISVQESNDAMTEALRNCHCLSEDLQKLDETLKITRLPK